MHGSVAQQQKKNGKKFTLVSQIIVPTVVLSCHGVSGVCAKLRCSRLARLEQAITRVARNVHSKGYSGGVCFEGVARSGSGSASYVSGGGATQEEEIRGSGRFRLRKQAANCVRSRPTVQSGTADARGTLPGAFRPNFSDVSRAGAAGTLGGPRFLGLYLTHTHIRQQFVLSCLPLTKPCCSMTLCDLDQSFLICICLCIYYLRYDLYNDVAQFVIN